MIRTPHLVLDRASAAVTSVTTKAISRADGTEESEQRDGDHRDGGGGDAATAARLSAGDRRVSWDFSSVVSVRLMFSLSARAVCTSSCPTACEWDSEAGVLFLRQAITAI
jgi:hypothetical protein